MESSISGYVKRVHGCRTEDKFYSLVGNVLYIYGAHEVRMTFCVFRFLQLLLQTTIVSLSVIVKYVV